MEGLCSGLLCLSFPTESDSQGLAVALTLRQRLSLGEPARRAQASCPAAPAPAMTWAPGYGEAALHAASCRLLPSAARGRRVSRLLIQHEPPRDPRTRRGAAGRRPSRRGCPTAARFSPSRPPSWWVISSPPSCGDPPGFPALAAHPWGFCRSYRNNPPVRRLRGRLGVMPPCAGCLTGTNRGLRGTGCPRSPPAAACQGVWCLAQPFRRGQSPVPVPWCPGRAGDCGPRGGTGQRWSPWHSSRSEGLGCSSARHRDPGQASPLAHSENIGTPGAFFPGLPFLRSRRAGCWRGWHAGRAGTAVWPTEPRLRGSSCSASRGGSPREGESRTWSWGGAVPGAGGGPACPPCCCRHRSGRGWGAVFHPSRFCPDRSPSPPADAVSTFPPPSPSK